VLTSWRYPETRTAWYIAIDRLQVSEIVKVAAVVTISVVLLPFRIKVKNAESGATVEMELENDNTIDEVIESAATFWNKEMGAYVVRKGKKVLRGTMALADAGVREDDMLELVPDPEGG
jgi:hypothetical protein